ncbi:MAG: Ig-like domain repeat protein [Terracidiphilus sp.]
MTHPTDVAVDSSGNVYVTDRTNDDVYEVPVGGSSAKVLANASNGFSQPFAVAVDSSGNLFVADINAGTVSEILAVDGSIPASPTINTLASGYEQPQGVTVDASGNVYFACYGNSTVYKIVAVDGSIPASPTITPLGGGFDGPEGVAVDSSGNIYIADVGNGAVKEMQNSCSSSSCVTTLASGLNGPEGVAVDSSRNVYVSSAGGNTLQEILAVDGTIPLSPTINSLGSSNISFNHPVGVAIDSTGDVFVANYGAPSVLKIVTAGVNFGTTAVAASTPLTQALQFNVTTGWTMSEPAVLTDGAASSDFSLVSGSTTCSGSVPVGTCTVTVNFAPSVSGTRTGAVELLNSGGTAIVAMAYLNGTGTGPQITFGPGVPTPLAESTTFKVPDGVAVDGSGNVYVADSGAPAVYQIAPGSATATALGSGFVSPKGVAVDGNGDVFVADPGGPTVKEILAVKGTISASSSIVTLGGYMAGGAIFSFSAPTGTAVDSAGNVYVADTSANAVDEILAASGYSVVTVLNSSSFSNPEGVAVDSGGNVYIADTGNAAVKEIVALDGHVTASSTINTLGGGFSFTSPKAVAVDGNGNVYVGDDAGVYEIPVGTSTVNTLAGGLSTASGVAVDAGGNIYYSNAGAAQVSELPLATAPTLTFALQGDGTSSAAQSVTILNDGNGATPLAAVSAGIGIAGDFILGDSAGDCTTTFSLLPGQSCNVSVEFTPVAPASGTVTGSVTLTDNDLNASPSTTQQIPLTGTALDIVITPTNTTLPAGSVGTAYTGVTFQATGGTGTGFTWSATGLPAGLSLDSSTGVLSGTPTAVATSASVTISATDSGTGSSGFQASQNYTITISQGTVTLSWTPPTSITYGTNLSSVLTATASVGSTPEPPTFGTAVYTASLNPSGAPFAVNSATVLDAGTYTLTLNYTPSDTTDYTTPAQIQETLTVNQATPTISIGDLPASGVYGGGFTATYSYSGTNGSPSESVASNSPGVCTVSGNVVSYVGVGTCSLTASATATTDYTAATGSAQTFPVNQATQTITNFTPPSSVIFGAPAIALSATGGASGNPVTFSVLSGPASVSGTYGSTLTITGAGTVVVAANEAGNSNYSAAPEIQQTIQVAPYGLPASFSVVAANSSVFTNVHDPLTITALDLYGNIVQNYAGSPVLSSVGLAATFSTPVFSSGIGTATVTFATTGTATVTATDGLVTGTSGSITVNPPPNYVVATAADDATGTASNCPSASCSLRDALAASQAAGTGTITFDATTFAAANTAAQNTITLKYGVLGMPPFTTITGPTAGSGATLANLVTLDGNGASTVFTVGSGVTDASIANLTIQHGNGAASGGIQNAGALTLAADSITGNTATGSGAGGGINNSGSLVLTSTTISGNTAGGTGGGISNSGTLTLADDTITGNSSSGSGGGIYNSSTLVASDSTLSGNTATTPSGGGGIDNIGPGTVALANSILSGNTSNSASDDLDNSGVFSNNLGNVIGVLNGAPVNATAINLAPLANYGGPTQTVVPLPGSPAICAGLAAGIPSGLTTDQRGLPNTNSNYPGYAACVDAGAVQTNYALIFSTQPAGPAVNTNFAAAVTLTESGNPFQPSVTIPLTLSGTGTLSGGSAATLGGVASYTLQVNAAGSSDTLTANLTLNGALTPPVAISTTSNSFDVGAVTPTVGLSLSAASVTYGTLVTLTATVPPAASGTVTFYNNGSTVLGAGSVSGGTATFSSSTLAAGSYSITAAYSGDSNYNSSTSSPQSLTVNQATATVTLGGLSQTYTGSALSATATTNPTGLTVTFTYNGSSTPPTAAGSYAVVGTVNDPNYQGTAAGTMTIAKATATVTWTPSATISYGTALAGELNASAAYNSQNVAGAFSYTAQPTGGTAVAVTGTTVLAAGSYTLAASFAPSNSTDYNTVTDSAPITVSQATLTVAANSANRVYGTANPTFTGSVTGAVNGDTFTESFSTPATINSNAGSYAIVPSATGTDLADYSVTVQDGTLTIAQAGTTTSMSASSASVTPGQSVTLSAQVISATTGTPTGSVNFYDGTSLLNTATLSGGAASFTTTTLSAGTTHQLTAIYSGDINFLTSSTSSSTRIVVAALDFSLTPVAPSSQTVNPGSAATYQMVVAPLYGTYLGPVTFTVSGLPTGATAAFSPSTVAADAGRQTVTLTVQMAATTAMRQAVPRPSATRGLQPFALAFLLLLGLGRMRRHGRNLRRMIYVVLLLIGGAATLLTGCGGHTTSTQTPETYTITVTATSSNLQHSTTFTLIAE